MIRILHYRISTKNDTERNTAIKLIKKGKMSLEEIADCVPEIEKYAVN